MTSKIYKSSQGKTVDLGTIMLQNEKTRAVGNMNVNARGDRLDSNNTVIETKPRQIQRQNSRTTNVSTAPVQTSALKAKKTRKNTASDTVNLSVPIDTVDPVPVTAPPAQDELVAGKVPVSGLAAAIARNREIKQELEKTRKQSTDTLRKI